jgi:glutaconate CoA-transferase subunit A
MPKLSTLAEAVASIPGGSHVSLSGFAISRSAMAFAHEVLRQGIKGLTVSQCVTAMEADMLAAGGAVERIVTGGGSRGRFGQHHCINRGIEQGTLLVEEYSSLSMAFRFLAGAIGLPFIPIRSLQGSDVLKRLQEIAPSETATLDDPFTGDEWLVLKPLVPDVAVIQVQVADGEGNAWIYGPRWTNEEQAKASERAIIITEQLVSTDLIRSEPERTVLPGFRVSHVVHLPFGAHPTAVYHAYDFDADHIRLYAKASRTPEGTQEYLDEYVYGTRDHSEYLELIGGASHLDELAADPALGY